MLNLGSRLSYSFKEGGALLEGDALEVEHLFISQREKLGRKAESNFMKID